MSDDIRLHRLRASAGIALGVSLLLSVGLWRSARDYPTLPLLESLPPWPAALGYVFFAALLALLAATVVWPAARWPVGALLGALLLECAWDQTRAQPWLFLYALLLGLSAARDRADALGAARLAVALTYVWSGLHKLNWQFAHGVFPWLARAFGLEAPAWVALGAAIAEIAVGVLLLVPRPRARLLGALGATLMHALILAAIGPLGHAWNVVVWPWNVFMIAAVWILFGRAGEATLGRRAPATLAVLVGCGALPALFFIEAWPAFLSSSLYSGKTPRAYLELSDAAAARFGPTVRGRLSRVPRGVRLNLDAWADAELGALPYAERAQFIALGRALCVRWDSPPPSELRLVLKGRPALTTGAVVTETLDCEGLTTPP